MKSVKDAMRLYAVTDRTWLNGKTLFSQVEEALLGGATCVQLREKELSFGAFLEEANKIRAAAKKYGVPFIINDSVEIALACGADGVHVGQSDRPAGETRKLIGDGRILGVSVQTVEQAVLAEQSGADYIGVGAVFSTSTKPDALTVSPETLRDICKSVSIPVVAIGGITAQNILSLCGSGIDGVAVVSALFSKPDIAGAARELLELVKRVVEA